MGTGEAAGSGVAAMGGIRGGVVARLADGRGAPPGPNPLLTARDALPAAVAVRRRVRVEMRSADGFAVGGAAETGETWTDTVGPAVSTESVPGVELLEKGVGWANVVAEAGAHAEPVPTSLGTAKIEAQASSAACKARPRPGQRSTVATEAETHRPSKAIP